MSMVVWVMMGIAIWHFTIFVPDRFWGGIVGAFPVAVVGAALFGFAVSGFTWRWRRRGSTARPVRTSICRTCCRQA